MKILIPVTGIKNEEIENIMVQGFHNTKFVCIYNCMNDQYEWLSTQSICEKEENLSLELKRRGINTIISKEIPLMTLSLFIESGFNVLKSQAENVEENIRLYYKDELEPFSSRSALGYSSCSTTCGSCNSSCN